MYLVLCALDGSYYCGSTTNVARRVREHQEGKGAKYTKGRLPVTLCFVHEVAGARSMAQKVEAQIKRLTHAQKAELIKRPHAWAHLLEVVP